MTTGQRHTIGKQFFDLRFNGSERGAMNLHASVSALNQLGIVPKIERILDRYADSASVLRIDRLEVDAGAVQLDQLEERLPAMIAETLDKALAGIATPDAELTAGSADQSDGTRMSKDEAAVEALLFFLRHATLPATFRPPSHEQFETQLLEAWKRPDLRCRAAEALASPTARQRLLAQFSRQVTTTLIEKLSPDAMPVIENILDELRRSALPEELVTRIERKLLDQTLAHSAPRQSIEPAELRDTLLAAAKSLPELTESARIQLPGNETAAETRARTKQVPQVPESAKDAVRQSRDSAPPAKRDGEQSTPSATAASRLERRTAETDATDQESVPAGHRGSGRSAGSPPTPPDASSGAITESPGKPDASPGSRDTSAFDREADDMACEQTNEQSAPEKSTERSTTASQASSPTDSDSDSTAEKHRKFGARQMPAPKTPEASGEHPDQRRGLYVENAGLVLLHPFLPQFFRALLLAGESELLRPGEALRLLHYLATGLENAPEYDLVLPKILCGLPPTSLVGEAAPLSDQEREESAALLSAVIGHWEALKNTGIDALRESFLKRDGKLTRWHDGGWLLQVESNSFDILLDRLPWGFSMIRLPWMPRMLRVEWRF
ncbi:hypothetical protein EST62_05735 [Chlorobaculum sp. 24CR]|uniref:contractile injection system tape measure protein n=1 Tax=Chlorobaculum sp. 24CR TaxID=2508878 RepID=UPI00100B0F33|nr:contractile injection system tape measure protein [Chlorobaculum sp. 24CR]RXK87840.1 hypothetical protein EST62_05735 [Chlorobaculum sp. 24CR]